MNIGCYLLSEGKFKTAFIQEKLLMELCKNLREKGEQIVYFEDKKFLVEGIYVPAKGSRTSLIILSDEK